MPARKLNPERAEQLRRDYEELSQWNGPITREAPDGGEVTVITSTEELARFHGVSKSRLYELKNSGWILRGSVINGKDPGGGGHDDEEMLRDVIGSLTDRVIDEVRTAAVRIAELERELAAALERNEELERQLRGQT